MLSRPFPPMHMSYHFNVVSPSFGNSEEQWEQLVMLGNAITTMIITITTTTTLFVVYRKVYD